MADDRLGQPAAHHQGLGYPSVASWRLIPQLAPSTVILLDNRGVGRSDVPKSAFTIADMAADAAAVIKRPRWGRCTWWDSQWVG